MSKPRVFFVERPRGPHINVDRASEHGEVVYLFEGGDRRAAAFDASPFLDEVLGALHAKQFNPEVDAVAVCTPILPTSLLFAALAARYTVFSFLAYNSTSGRYVHRTLDLRRYVAARV